MGRRLLRFLWEWLLLFAWGDGWIERIARWLIGLVLIAGAIFGVASGEQAWFYLELAPSLVIRAAPSPGVLALSSLFLTWALVTAGAAWVRSHGPELWVADQLEEDREYRVFRLRVRLRGRGTACPAARIERVVDEQDADAIPRVQLPIELRWTHEGPNVRPELSKDMETTVGVVIASEGAVGHVGNVRVADAGLRVHGMSYSPEVWTVRQFGQSRRVAVKVSVSIPGISRTVTRWFGFIANASSPMLHESVRLEVDRDGKVIWRARD